LFLASFIKATGTRHSFLCGLNNAGSTGEHDSSDRDSKESIKAQARYAAEKTREPAANESAESADNNTERNGPLRIGFHKKKQDPADDCADYHPNNDFHIFFKLINADKNQA
jgi:hypothetical protein